MDVNILGISAYYHDSAAAILCNGKLIAAAQEERFTRNKNDASFPINSIRYCLNQSGLSLQEIDFISYYDKPFVKFERLFKTLVMHAPIGFMTYLNVMPAWFKEKLFLKKTLSDEFNSISNFKKCPPILFSLHHQSHAASAFYPSPFKKAAILCVDGVGEWTTTSVWIGEGNNIRPQWELQFPHSIGLLYSAFTYYCGFKVNSGEYKLMGLAPYGEPRYVDIIRNNLIDIKEDGTYKLNLEYFNFPTQLNMINGKFCELFGGLPREPESEITQREMDIAKSIQVVTEEVLLRLARTIHREFGLNNLCLSGGVALNCVANGRILRETPFENVWVQPAASDAGSALGAAYLTWYEYLGHNRILEKKDSMQGAYLGPDFSNQEIKSALEAVNGKFHHVTDQQLFKETAQFIAEGLVVGWFQGRMEFGPRALGNRSILGDPRNTEMQKTLNLKIKKRESFRPFAPAILFDDLSDYFELDKASPYMQFVANVKKDMQILNANADDAIGLNKLKVQRSIIPAVTHVDCSARIQTVNKETNVRFYKLIEEFKKITGCSVLINTSFNVRGEPIVCTPKDAFRCFMQTEMDCLVMGNYILRKSEQTELKEKFNDEFDFD